MSDYIPIPLKRFAVIIENYTVRYLKGVQVVFALCFSLFELDPPPFLWLLSVGELKVKSNFLIPPGQACIPFLCTKCIFGGLWASVSDPSVAQQPEAYWMSLLYLRSIFFSIPSCHDNVRNILDCEKG